MVRTSLDNWTLTSWREINVDDMESELRRFLKEIRLLDKGEKILICTIARQFEKVEFASLE